MIINLTNTEKEIKNRKSYWLTDEVINGLENLKEKTNHKNFNNLLIKMIELSEKHLEKELNK